MGRQRHILVVSLASATMRRERAGETYQRQAWEPGGMAKRLAWAAYRDAQRLEQLAEADLHSHDLGEFLRRGG